MIWYEFLAVRARLVRRDLDRRRVHLPGLRHGRRAVEADPAELAQFAGRAGILGERVFPPVAPRAARGRRTDDRGQLVVGQPLGRYSHLLLFRRRCSLSGLGVITPMAKRLPIVGPATEEGQALIRRIFPAYCASTLVLLFSIVFAMTVKPTSDDAWTVTLAVALAVGLAALLWVLVGADGARVRAQPMLIVMPRDRIRAHEIVASTISRPPPARSAARPRRRGPRRPRARPGRCASYGAGDRVLHLHRLEHAERCRPRRRRPARRPPG